ncbi:amidase family protein, partial [Bacteroides pyogenes]
DEYNVNPQIKELFDETIEKLKSLGANIDIVSLNYLDLINDVYTVIMAIEVESNIAKIDGLRYGQSVEKYDSTEDFYVKNRTDNFGEEVRRRIALGNFFASKDNDQKYYKQAMKIRGAVRSQIDKLFENYDALITPTT